MLPRTSTTSNHSRLRSERDATAIADSMASETDLSELPTTSVFTYVRLVAICSSLWRSACDSNLEPIANLPIARACRQAAVARSAGSCLEYHRRLTVRRCG